MKFSNKIQLCDYPNSYQNRVKIWRRACLASEHPDYVSWRAMSCDSCFREPKFSKR